MMALSRHDSIRRGDEHLCGVKSTKRVIAFCDMKMNGFSVLAILLLAPAFVVAQTTQPDPHDKLNVGVKCCEIHRNGDEDYRSGSTRGSVEEPSLSVPRRSSRYRRVVHRSASCTQIPGEDPSTLQHLSSCGLVLSGFVIAFSYENRLLRGLSFRSFVAARLVRLYPVYLLGTVVGFVLLLYIHRGAAYSINSWIPWHSVLFGVLLVPDFFLSSKTLDIFPIDVHAWSLFGEILANILYGALVCRRLASNWILALFSLSSLSVLVLWIFRVSGTLDLGSCRESFPCGLARVGYSFFIGSFLGDGRVSSAPW
jgi:hypothetical protein